MLRFDEPFAYINLTDFGDGRGLLQIHSDYGSYSYYWGAMGEGYSLGKFLAQTDPGYVHTKLQSCMTYQGMKKDQRIWLHKFMIQCWPAVHDQLRKENL